MTAKFLIHNVMERNEWITPYQLQHVCRDCGLMVSESATTARLREMRKLGYRVETRPAKSRNPNSRVLEYRARRMDA